jgi:hypothetical protein
LPRRDFEERAERAQSRNHTTRGMKTARAVTRMHNSGDASAAEPAAKRKRRTTARGDDFTYDDKEVEEGIREQAKRQPKAASLKPKAAAAAATMAMAAAPLQAAATEHAEPAKLELTVEEKSLMSKYVALSEVKEKYRRAAQGALTAAEVEAERTSAAREATKAALAAVEEQRKQQPHATDAAAEPAAVDGPPEE